MLCIILATASFAAEDKDFYYDRQISVFYNGSRVSTINETGREMAPIFAEGEYYLPVYTISRIIGRQFMWSREYGATEITDEPPVPLSCGITRDSATKSEYVSARFSLEAKFKLGDKIASSKRIIFNNTTYIQASMLKEFGYTVMTDELNGTLDIMNGIFKHTVETILEGTSVTVSAQQDQQFAYGVENYVRRLYPYGGDPGIVKSETSSSVVLSVRKADIKAFKSRSDKIKAEVMKALEEIIKPEMSDREKIMAINDYICGRWDYDDKLIERSIDEAWNSDKVTCTGYAKIFAAMAKSAGVLADTYAPNEKANASRQYHMWNRVRVDGDWLHIDVCWNDSVVPNRYCLLTAAEMEAAHK